MAQATGQGRESDREHLMMSCPQVQHEILGRQKRQLSPGVGGRRLPDSFGERKDKLNVKFRCMRKPSYFSPLQDSFDPPNRVLSMRAGFPSRLRKIIAKREAPGRRGFAHRERLSCGDNSQTYPQE